MRSKRRRIVKLLSCDVASPHAELKALTTTPFMVEIVMQILRQLQRLRGTDAVMKQQLALLLDSDDAVELVWGQLSAWRRKPRGGESKCIVPSSICSVPDDDLEDVRNALEVRKEARDGASTKAMESLKVLSQDIAKAFGEIKNGAKVTVPQSLLVHDNAQGAAPEPRARPKAETTGGAANFVEEQHPQTAARESAKEEHEAPSISIGSRQTENAKAKDNQTQVMFAPDACCSERATDVPSESTESIVDENAINQMLQRVLRRQPIRRHRIYELFVQHYLEREARKQTGTISSAELMLEGRSFAERLALKMTEDNLSKVVVRKASALFDADGEWDVFVSTRDPLLVAARNAAPVRFQGAVLSFTHKTVQEFLCAEGLREGGRACVFTPI